MRTVSGRFPGFERVRRAEGHACVGRSRCLTGNAAVPRAGTDTSGIQNRLGVLFFMLLYLSLMSLSSLPIWRDEKLLFMRERASGVYGTRESRWWQCTAVQHRSSTASRTLLRLPLS